MSERFTKPAIDMSYEEIAGAARFYGGEATISRMYGFTARGCECAIRALEMEVEYLRRRHAADPDLTREPVKKFEVPE